MRTRFNIQLMTWSDALPLARAVRESVFIEEQEVPRELEWDEWDEHSDHAVALDGGFNAIGTARLLPIGCKGGWISGCTGGRIGRMAVLRPWRGRGVGAALLEALLQLARDRDIPEVTLHAQTHAAGFYRRFGFTARGDEFLEAGIPHVEMSLRLSRTPDAQD